MGGKQSPLQTSRSHSLNTKPTAQLTAFFQINTHTHSNTYISKIHQAILPKVNTKHVGPLDWDCSEASERAPAEKVSPSCLFMFCDCWWLSSVWAWDYLFISVRSNRLCGLRCNELYSRSEVTWKWKQVGCTAAGRGEGRGKCDTSRGRVVVWNVKVCFEGKRRESKTFKSNT